MQDFVDIPKGLGAAAADRKSDVSRAAAPGSGGRIGIAGGRVIDITASFFNFS
jgi:hypothetical protein